MKNLCLYWRLLINHFWASLAILLTVKNLLVLIPCIKDVIDGYGVLCLLILIVFSIIYSCCMLWWKTEHLELNLNKTTKLTVSYGDLFAQEGIKVIPVNEYFDTHWGMVL